MSAPTLRRVLLTALAASTLLAAPPLLAVPSAVASPNAAATPTAAPPTTPARTALARTAATPTVRIAAADQVVADAASWLAGELSAAGTVRGSFAGENGGAAVEFTDYGRSLDSALALLAAGGQDAVLGRTLTSVEDATAVAEYTQGAPFDRPDAAYVGATAKLALVVELTDGDATSVGGVDLLAQLRSLALPTGRFADRSDFGSFANLFGHAFALLVLDTAGTPPDDALVQGLLASQCADGSFPESYEPAAGATCTGQVDATGLVLQALGALDLAGGDPAQRAAQWLSGQQQADGSFPGEAPVNSTGYAVLGLNAVAAPTSAAVPYLTTQQNADGGLRRGAGPDQSSDLFATAQALPALAGATFQDSARVVARQAVMPTPAPGTPTPEPGTPTPAPGTPTPAPGTPTPAPGTPTPAPVPPTPTPTGPPGVTPAPVGAAATGTVAIQRPGPVGSSDALPRTGNDLPLLLLAGGVLLAVGSAMTAGARPRRRGRHAAAR